MQQETELLGMQTVSLALAQLCLLLLVSSVNRKINIIMLFLNKSLLFSTILLGISRRYSVIATKEMSGEICPMNKTSSSSYSPGEHSVAYVTAPSEELAKKIGRGLVTKKLAACVNIVPKITSIYEWEGKINEDSEVLMMIKTRTSKINQLTEYVKANHPYTVCEVISLPIQSGNEAYLKWIGDIVPSH